LGARGFLLATRRGSPTRAPQWSLLRSLRRCARSQETSAEFGSVEAPAVLATTLGEAFQRRADMAAEFRLRVCDVA